MKRKVVYILLSMVIAATLCACGDTAMRDDVTVTTTPNMTNSPVATPRADDGVVTDRDGIIEDNMPDDGIVQTSPKADTNKTDGAKASTQPTSSAKPTATTKP